MYSSLVLAMSLEAWTCIGVCAAWLLIGAALSIRSSWRESQQEKERELEARAAATERRRLEAWDREKSEYIQQRAAEQQEEDARREETIADMKSAVHRIADEKSVGFPWLAAAFADYFHLADLKEAKYLEEGSRPVPMLQAIETRITLARTLLETPIADDDEVRSWPAAAVAMHSRAKRILDEAHTALVNQDLAHDVSHRSAPRAADKVREHAARRREAERVARVNQYLIRYYEALFPWLIDFKEEGIDEFVRIEPEGVVARDDPAGGTDPAKKWLTDAEYDALDDSEKYQLALDRYKQRRMNRWQIGRAYERYAGHVYESVGYTVTFQGIIEGFADLGRDIIARRGNDVEVVQCKCWSARKTIHEKHIFQLFGTLTAFRLDHPQLNANGRFMTSTTLSPRARQFAERLGVNVDENHMLTDYPCVKCNVARKDGEKIYHLPFDQQYDKVMVEQSRGERYVATVAEAEALGFRRAYRWRGGK